MYTAFASVYDRLMADVDYTAWSDYYRRLMARYMIFTGKVAECACGTGSLTIPLAEQGFQMTGVDASPDMLFEASQKARKAGAMIPFVRQDMRELRLHRQMDAVLCTCDGVNYLPGDQALGGFFRSAFQALRPGGGLFFDISTPYKLRRLLGNRFLCDETEDVAYLWKNTYDEPTDSVELALSIFVRQKDDLYQRIEETQRQYAHTAPKLIELLELAGFAQIQLFGEQTFLPPTEKQQRWHVGALKPRPE